MSRYPEQNIWRLAPSPSFLHLTPTMRRFISFITENHTQIKVILNFVVVVVVVVAVVVVDFVVVFVVVVVVVVFCCFF